MKTDMQLEVRPAPCQQTCDANDEAMHIEVLIDGSTVTLRGTVNSWVEHATVQQAVWRASGIRHVRNEVKVVRVP